MKRSLWFLRLFLITCFLELLALVMNWQGVHELIKPLIVPSLLGFYAFRVANWSGVFMAALLFSWLGDVLLLFQGELFFMGGLVSFLTAHVLFILMYRKLQIEDRSKELLPTQKMRYAFPVILTGTGLIVILLPNLGGLQIPVIVYAIVLMLMVISALTRFGRTTAASFNYIFSGACLFMISDSLLAINKFYSPFAMSGILIMSTYMAAQYLIVSGVINHQNSFKI